MGEENIFLTDMQIDGAKVQFRTHRWPHLDEITVYWLIKKFADGGFAEEYANDGVVTVGIEGGVFDEHFINANEQDPAKRECAATLVAKALGLADNPELKQILNYVKMRDQTSNAGNGVQSVDLAGFDIASGVKLFHSQNPDNPEIAFNWAIALLEAKYQEQLHFFTVTKTEFETKATVKSVKVDDDGLPKRVQVGDDRSLCIASIISDDPLVSKYARSKGVAIFIQKNTGGQVQIFTDHQKVKPAFIDNLAQMLRFEEQKKRGKVLVTDWDDLAQEGMLVSDEDATEEEKRLGLTVWFYHKNGRQLLNGSLTKPDVVKTVLTLEEITGLAMIAVSPDLFPSRRRVSCLAGICTNSDRELGPCPWHVWGRSVCRKIRYDVAQQSQNGNEKK